MEELRLFLGAMLMIQGRKIYWLFVGGLGFFVTLTLFDPTYSGMSEQAVRIIGIIVALIGALMAIFLQRLAIFVGGFLGGGFLLILVIELFGVRLGGLNTYLFLVGGIVGALIVNSAFDGALIFFSSTIGAAMIVQTLDLIPLWRFVTVPTLTVVGMGLQALIMRDEDG
ncbi:MAG: hypothetical protein PVH60_05130 [Anaerolineales bacterium]|jgi:hypothetical protein